ncbi:GNAT family N-acetyltransferase [Nocardioides donggukensis]|uniref:GNAT family N-acetyltransferase n=1 Tax=Nocardioides donggukensis TaxID=2774019 RepID=A0A927K440_9ACTN|nr:GNAT family N-acetyltransferase [Nocardioides donggukensis]MBD8870312.1 GNAT family N-acetyltransferase [Nocardioides donggukensis]
MDSGGDSRGVGRHLLGPHVVGLRIVVRRVLRGETGPSGGPALTDVLGTCVSWSDGECVVAPEEGAPVRIAVGDIVSGKPVPPRPSVRVRVSAAEAEAHVADLWPHLEQQPLGGWTLRSDPAPVGRLRRRANSCLAMGEPGLDLDEAQTRIREWYADRSRPALAQVELGSEVERAFVEAGWAPLGDGDAHFLLGSLARTRRTLSARRARPDAVAGQAQPGRAQPGQAQPERFAEPGGVRVVVPGGPDAGPDAGRDTGEASGRASCGGDWLGLHGLHVDPAVRRRGLGLAVIDELLEWGAEQGATTVWLHVETDNAPAIALYDSLGLSTHHTCRYLAAR